MVCCASTGKAEMGRLWVWGHRGSVVSSWEKQTFYGPDLMGDLYLARDITDLLPNFVNDDRGKS